MEPILDRNILAEGSEECGRIARKLRRVSEAFLDESVFAGNSGVEVKPDPADVEGFRKYIAAYRKYLSLEEAAIR